MVLDEQEQQRLKPKEEIVKPLAVWIVEGFMTQAEFAEKSKVHPSVISRVIKGGRGGLHPNTMKAISEALGVEPQQITELAKIIERKGNPNHHATVTTNAASNQ